MHPVSSYFSFQVMQSSVKFGHQFVHTSVYVESLVIDNRSVFHPCHFREKAQWHKTQKICAHMASALYLLCVQKKLSNCEMRWWILNVWLDTLFSWEHPSFHSMNKERCGRQCNCAILEKIITLYWYIY